MASPVSDGAPLGTALAARLAALAWLVTGQAFFLPEPFLPFVPGLDGAPALVWRALVVLSVVSAIAIVLGHRLRAACLLLGGTILFATLASRPWFSNNRVFTGCLFLMLGLDPQAPRAPLVRLQLALVYFGAGLDKLCDADWRSGRFLDSLLRGLAEHGTLWAPGGRVGLPDPAARLYVTAAERLSPLLLGRALGWATILVEIAIGLGLALRPSRWALGLSLVLQASIAMVTGSTLGMFLLASMIACTALVEWPAEVVAHHDPARRFHRLAARVWGALDWSGRVTWRTSSGALRVVAGDREGRLRELLRQSPWVYVAGTLLLASPAFRWWMPAVIVLALLAPLRW
jgi:uncharacterized membrane protein YphA (DoxX/SURF4 family)